MKRKLLVMLFAALASVAVLPAMAFAANYNVWVDGTQVTDENKDNVLAGTSEDGRVSFKPLYTTAGGTLTLCDYEGGPIEANGDLTIELTYGEWGSDLYDENRDGSVINGEDFAIQVNGNLDIVGVDDLEGNLEAVASGPAIDLTNGGLRINGFCSLIFASGTSHAIRFNTRGSGLAIDNLCEAMFSSTAGLEAVYNVASQSISVSKGSSLRQLGEPTESVVRYKNCSSMVHGFCSTNCKVYNEKDVEVSEAREWDVLTLVADPAPEGQRFLGWNIEGVGGVYLSSPTSPTLTYAMGGEYFAFEATYETVHDISDAVITMPGTLYTYSGKSKMPKPTVRDAAGNILEKDVDYTLSYKNNINAGTATVTIAGIGGFIGSVDKTFTIYRQKLSKDRVKVSDCAYTGKARKGVVKVTNSLGTTICNGTASNKNVKLVYSTGRKNVGTYSVKVTGVGNYTGTVTKTFKVNPPATKITGIAGGKKLFGAVWTKKSTQVTGYQLRYSTSKTFKSYKTLTATSYKNNSMVVSKLKAKTKYYVKVRTYKTVKGKKYYSAWSDVKTVTTK